MSNLVLRTRPKPILTRSLRRRDRQSPVEFFKTWWPLELAVLAVLLILSSAFSIHHGAPQARPIFYVVVSSLLLLFASIWTGIAADGTDAMSFKNRAWHVYAERLRKTRAHKDVDKTRLRELRNDYSRYSVNVEQAGEAVRLVIIEHFRPKFWQWRPFIRWEARKTKLAVNRSGSIESDIIALREIHNPTTERVLGALDVLQKTAEELENRDYAESLKRHSAYAVSVAATPPPVRRGVRMKVDDRSREHMAEVEARAIKAGEPHEGG